MKIRIELSEAEARALLACAGEGFEGLATDDGAAKTYLGGKRGIDAAERAMKKLVRAVKGDDEDTKQ
jgi:hypothetical protein